MEQTIIRIILIVTMVVLSGCKFFVPAYGNPVSKKYEERKEKREKEEKKDVPPQSETERP